MNTNFTEDYTILDREIENWLRNTQSVDIEKMGITNYWNAKVNSELKTKQLLTLLLSSKKLGVNLPSNFGENIRKRISQSTPKNNTRNTRELRPQLETEVIIKEVKRHYAKCMEKFMKDHGEDVRTFSLNWHEQNRINSKSYEYKGKCIYVFMTFTTENEDYYTYKSLVSNCYEATKNVNAELSNDNNTPQFTTIKRNGSKLSEEDYKLVTEDDALYFTEGDLTEGIIREFKLQSCYNAMVQFVNKYGEKNNAQHGGGKEYKTYNKRRYLVRTGERGGKYILVKGEKIYVSRAS